MFSDLEKQRLEALIRLSDVMKEMERLYSFEVNAGDYESFDSLKSVITSMKDDIFFSRSVAETVTR